MANGSEPRQAEWEIFAQRDPLPPYSDPDFLAKASVIPLRTTDGMNFDFKRGVIYVADFANNAVAEVSTKDRSIRFFAQSPDNDGQNGELNQPGEACVWNGRLAVTCFDMLTTPDMVNRNHDPKATIVFLPLEQPDVKKH